jgi:hypothetical protein
MRNQKARKPGGFELFLGDAESMVMTRNGEPKNLIPPGLRGRPQVSRQTILEAIRPKRPGAAGAIIRRSVIARQVGCSKTTVGRAVSDLEVLGQLYPVRRLGRRGLLVQFHPPFSKRSSTWLSYSEPPVSGA